MPSITRVHELAYFYKSDQVCVLIEAHVLKSLPDGAWLSVNLGEVLPEVEDLTYISVAKSIWHTSLFTSMPESTVFNILRTFANSPEVKYPIDLPYEWGGEFYGRVVAMPSSLSSLHAQH